MARGRMISKSLSTSRKWAKLSTEPLGEFAQSLYPLIIAHSDDFGKMEANPLTVHHLVSPYTKRPHDELAAALLALHRCKLITLYKVGGNTFLQITDFERHQSGLHKRTSSKFPDIPGNSGKYRVPRGNSREFPPELKRREENSTKEHGRAKRARPPLPQKTKNGQNLIRKLAFEVVDRTGVSADLGELAEALKTRCAQLHIAYDGPMVQDAITTALAQRLRTG